MDLSKCTRIKIVSKITGEVTVQELWSEVERQYDRNGLCGIGAKYFEAKPVKKSLWKRFCVLAGKDGIGPLCD